MTTKNSIYSIYDRKAQYYLPPFTVRSDADAERAFIEAVTVSDTPIAQYPADFDLVCLGSIDLDTGMLTQDQMPRLMVNGLVALEAATRTRARYASMLPNGQEKPEVQAEPDAS